MRFFSRICRVNSRLLTRLLIGSAVFKGAALAAGLFCGPKPEFELGIEYLFVRPQICDLGYAISDSNSFGDVTTVAPGAVDLALPIGNVRGLCPNYQSAFRLRASSLFCNATRDVTLSYARIATEDPRSTIVPGTGGLWITLGDPKNAFLRLNNAIIAEDLPGAIDALAKERLNLRYNVVDCTAGCLKNRCDFWCRSFAGIRYANIEACQQVYYQGTVTQVVITGVDGHALPTRIFQAQIREMYNRTRSWCLGPRVGIDVSAKFLAGLGFSAHFGLSLLAGEGHEHLFQHDSLSHLGIIPVNPGTDIDATLDASSGARCLVIPEIDGRMGINYSYYACDCLSLFFEVGWETTSYVNALLRTRFYEQGGTNRQLRQSFSIDGLYVVVKVAF